MGDIFSKKDLELLYELSYNSRIPLNKIAKKLKLSSQNLNYRIEKLTQEKVILNYYSMFDYSCFGYVCFKVFFNLNTTNLDHFMSALKSNHNVISIIHCGGKWDLCVSFTSKNVSKFNKELKNILSQKVIRSYLILTNISSFELGRRYLIEDSPPIGIKIVGGDRDLLKIDLIDQKILYELYKNPKVTSVYISSKYNTNPKTIIKKIKSLEARGIIKGYTINIDESKLNLISNRILIKYISIEKEEEILKFVRQTKQVTKFSKILGEFDLEIDIKNKDIEEFKMFCSELRSNFGAYFQNFETYPIFNYEKVSYLSDSFFLE